MSIGTVLVVEDDLDLREALADTLELAGHKVMQAESAEQALQMLQRRVPELVVSDINMPGMSGHQLLQRLQQEYSYIPVVLMTAYGDIANAVEAMRTGAVDYLLKPFKPQVLLDTIGRYLSGTGSQSELSQPVAESASSQQLLQLAKKVADTDSTVLISGESGTGKEVLARYIHNNSPRAEQPFVAINCAAIPENMLEATLFGHEKGAFTGAYNSSAGKFEQANGGTILLDEISEMDLGLQAKLLRVLQEREVERVGGKKVISLDVRVVATTNRDLQQHVRDNKFREDLYYRLSVFPLQWLPLRQRREDVVPLANRLIQMHCQKMNKAPVSLNTQAADKLTNCDWPGNVRELDNVIQRALILQSGPEIQAEDLMLQPATMTLVSSESQPKAEPEMEQGSPLGSGVKQREYQLIADALRNEGGRKNRAAEKLGISPRTLRYKMAQMRESGFDLDAAMRACG